MTDDIVDRLRQTHRVGCECVGCEAAAEIEQLRKDLKEERFARLIEPPPFDSWHVLLWSQTQRAFHIEKLGNSIYKNRRAFYRSVPTDFIVLGFEETKSGCSGARLMLEQNWHVFQDNPIKDEATDEH